MQKLSRAVIGTNNMDNCSRYCQAPATIGLFRTVGYGGDSGSISDIEQAELVIIIGSNTAESHPVLATRVKRAHKLRGQKLIVADLARARDGPARRCIPASPNPAPISSGSPPSRAISSKTDSPKPHFIEQWVNGAENYIRSLDPFTLEMASERTGLPSETLVKVAHMIAEAGSVCILWAMGVTQHIAGSDTSTAISNLLLATGNYMRPGTGAYPLRGHNNVQGASDHGAMPNFFPGYQRVDDPAIRQKFEQAWKVSLPPEPGLNNHEMIDAINDGRLKSMYVFGEEMSLVDSNANYVAESLSKLDFFVMQDIFFS